jgi:hypothetical protein
LPNIAPPSSFWLLPSRDQSFIAAFPMEAWRDYRAEYRYGEVDAAFRP